MPEFPEVYAFCSIIKKTSLNKKIVAITLREKRVLKNSSASQFKDSLINTSFKTVKQRGKYILVETAHSLVVILHFGMAGSVHYAKSASPLKNDDTWSRIIFHFNNHHELRWIDKRLFGKVLLINKVQEEQFLKIGPNAIDISQKEFLDFLARREKRNIKVFLMDQSIISGIGNEYSDEIIFHAEINPYAIIKNLSVAQRKHLYVTMLTILKKAMRLRKNNQLFSKNYWLLEHRSKKGFCPLNSKHHLEHGVIGGRTSYWCPIHQK